MTGNTTVTAKITNEDVKAFQKRIAQMLKLVMDGSDYRLENEMMQMVGAAIDRNKIGHLREEGSQSLSMKDILVLDRYLKGKGYVRGITSIIDQRPLDALALAKREVVFVLGAKPTPLELAAMEEYRWLARTTYLSINDVLAYSEVRLALEHARRGDMVVDLEPAMIEEMALTETKWSASKLVRGERSLVAIGAPISNAAADALLRFMFPMRPGGIPIRFGWTNDKARGLNSPFMMSTEELRSAPPEARSPWGTVGVMIAEKPFWCNRREEWVDAAGQIVTTDLGGSNVAGKKETVYTEYGVIAAQRNHSAVLAVLAGTIGPGTITAARAFTNLLTHDIPDGNEDPGSVLIAVVKAQLVEREEPLGDNRELVGEPEVVWEEIWSPTAK